MKLMTVAATALLLSLVSLSVVSGMGGMGGEHMMGNGGMMGNDRMGGMSMGRHRHVMRNGIDPEYADRSNPLKPTTSVLEKGKQLYEANCVSCHGPAGQGNGEAADALDPKPTNIAAFSQMPMASDGYLYWAIAEGGAPVGSAMPAFKGTLEENDVWRIITYLRKGFDGRD